MYKIHNSKGENNKPN